MDLLARPERMTGKERLHPWRLSPLGKKSGWDSSVRYEWETLTEDRREKREEKGPGVTRCVEKRATEDGAQGAQFSKSVSASGQAVKAMIADETPAYAQASASELRTARGHHISKKRLNFKTKANISYAPAPKDHLILKRPQEDHPA